MIRNIPIEYSRDMLLQEINNKFINMYDFLNLPFDYKVSVNFK